MSNPDAIQGDLRDRFSRIRAVLSDVDGVLTDGKLYFDKTGNEFKSFDIQDGHGISMAKRAGFLVGFVSGRPSAATNQRAKDLGVEILRMQATNKMDMVNEIKDEHGLADDEICFLGDELVDLPVLYKVGLAVAVPNAVDDVRDAAHYVTERRGGNGALREVIDLLLKIQGRWEEITAKYRQ